MAAGNFEKYKSDGSLAGNALEWLDARFPATSLWKGHLSEYYAPKNFTFWYFFGSLALLVLVIHIVTGIFLVMHYKPDAALNANGVPVAFASVEYIMRDVPGGWLIRYMHSTGASAFFIVVYLHMFRGLIYGSYRKPRELTWLFGVGIFLVLMGDAFFGYLLPWGQMSYWGAQVIVNLFGAFPLVLLGLVAAHVLALHETGSNNPDGVEIKANKDENGIPRDGIPFHPYYTVKDIVGVVVFLMVFSAVLFWAPEGGGYFLETPNFYPADPLKTPPHIAPVWYFTPFYSILRAMVWNFFGLDAKFWGVVAMGASVVIFAGLPWLDRSPVKSIRYRGPITKLMYTIFVICFFILGYLGTLSPSPMGELVSQICSVFYFGFFLAMPWWSRMDKFKPVPDRVTFK